MLKETLSPPSHSIVICSHSILVTYTDCSLGTLVCSILLLWACLTAIGYILYTRFSSSWLVCQLPRGFALSSKLAYLGTLIATRTEKWSWPGSQFKQASQWTKDYLRSSSSLSSLPPLALSWSTAWWAPACRLPSPQLQRA